MVKKKSFSHSFFPTFLFSVCADLRFGWVIYVTRLFLQPDVNEFQMDQNIRICNESRIIDVENLFVSAASLICSNLILENDVSVSVFSE